MTDKGKRRVPVDMDRLDDAFEGMPRTIVETAAYLDLETGDVLTVTEEDLSALEELLNEVATQDPEAVEAAIGTTQRLPDWQRDSVRDAWRLQMDDGSRLLPVPKQNAHEGYRDMIAFIQTVANARLQQRLADAVSGPHPFRRFKDALLSHPSERERWFAFCEGRRRQRMWDWLQDEGIEPIPRPASS